MDSNTRDKRLVRSLQRKHMHECNNYGRRIVWVREKLSLKLVALAAATDIPKSTLSDWECGCRSASYEELLVLSIYLGKLWKSKYRQSFPMYDGRETREITLNFILFGKDPTLDEALELRKVNSELEKRIALEILAREEREREKNAQQIMVLDV